MSFLLKPEEFRRLDALRLNPRKSFSGRIRGERLTRKKGVSIEFADYREYTEGDDLRHLDWNVLARLETPVMRTYQDEEDLAVHLLVDTSPSMEFGEPTKLEAAKRIGSVFAYVALNGGDAVFPRAIGQREPDARPIRGRAGYPRLDRWLSGLTTEGPRPSSLVDSLRQFARSTARAGLVVLVSDGLDAEAASALRTVAARGHELLFIQVLSDAELDPDLEGDLRLNDPEGGPPVEITANSYVLEGYKRNLALHNQGIAEALRRVGGRHTLVRADEKLEALLKDVFRRDGWLI